MGSGEYVCDYAYEGPSGPIVCGQHFETQRALSVHRANHGRKKLQCPRCGKAVMNLETHLRKVHGTEGQKLIEAVIEMVRELERLRAENAELKRQIREK